MICRAKDISLWGKKPRERVYKEMLKYMHYRSSWTMVATVFTVQQALPVLLLEPDSPHWGVRRGRGPERSNQIISLGKVISFFMEAIKLGVREPGALSGPLPWGIVANMGENGQQRERSCVEGWMQEEGRRVEKEQEVEAQTRGWRPWIWQGRNGQVCEPMVPLSCLNWYISITCNCKYSD